MQYKYGIDFGTTNSSIAIRFMGSDDNEHTYVLTLKDTLPREVIPSVVLVNKKGTIYAGQEAVEYNYQHNDRKNDFKFIKKIKLDLEKNGNNLEYHLGNKTISGIDLIAAILKVLRIKADKGIEELGIDVSGVVMGVPVQYGDVQKNIMKEALVRAGFYKNITEANEKTEFVSEPIAVAVHYGLNLKQDKTVLIFDFGGGTLDLAVVNLKHQITDDILHPHETLAKGRITLGGEELTKTFFINCFCKKYGVSRIAKEFRLNIDISSEELWGKLLETRDGIRLIEKLEQCKCELSKSFKSTFHFIGRDVQLKEKDFFRDEFQDAISEQLDEIDDLIEQTLEDADIHDRYDIDRVILAGGSSLIPCIQDILISKFGSSKVASKLNENDQYINKIKRIKVSEHEVLTSIVRGLAMVGCKEESLIDDVVDSDYGVWDSVKDDLITIIPKGIPVKETFINRISLEGQNINVECVNNNLGTVEVIVYQRVYKNYKRVLQELGKINFHNTRGSKYQIFMQIDKKQGSLEVVIYDLKRNRWIDEIPLQQRVFNIT
ncbi:MAG: Hsp70 family protein [Selenomonadaceae bacterium]|nr:Hsp70 family protein [Selenomonadaceae bacterium]